MIIRSTRMLSATRGATLLLPDFLVPVLSSNGTSRSFSSTSKCRSRIGGAPLSLPAEVEIQILEPLAQKKKDAVMTELVKTVEVKGPLGTRNPPRKHTQVLIWTIGKMTVQLPPYMSLSHDKEKRKATLSILDREQRKQREMWGT